MNQGESNWTKTQLVVFFVLLLLTLDEINPVKIILRAFPSLSAWHIAVVCAGLMIYIFISDVKNLIYFGIKIFFHSILSIFFRDVRIIGRENIPRHGPVIFTVNHANQFMDAVTVLCTCQMKISYLMAEASWKRRIIGDIAWALDVVPVKRAQDEAKPGTGSISLKEPAIDDEEKLVEVVGNGTKFTAELSPGDKVRPPNTAIALKVKRVEGDNKMYLEGLSAPAEYPFTKEGSFVSYDILRRVPLEIVFQKVLDKLEVGGAVGIFPEGGSHDRTDLLPIKPGISLIAYSALDKDGLNIPIVPVGLNYFRAHRWRGRAVVEYGRPILIDPATLPDFQAGGASRRKVCNNLLEEIESSMRSVIVSAPDFETLELIHTARRLYQRKKGPLDPLEKQDLSRRFAEGYKRLLLMTDGNPPKEWLDLQDRIKAYRAELKDLGLKDYQVPQLTGEHLEEELDVNKVDGDTVLSILQLPYNIAHLLLLLAVAAIPSILLNLPVGILAGLYAERRRKVALAGSKVKVKGYDVMLTEKVVFCIVMVPTLWIVYGLLLVSFTNLELSAIILILNALPLFAYMGIVVAEAGMVDWKDLRPYLMRLRPSTRARLACLPETRRKLQEDLRAFIRSIGPALGKIYYDKELDWKEIQEVAQQHDEEKKKDK